MRKRWTGSSNRDIKVGMRAGKHLLLLVLSLATTVTLAQKTSGVEVTVVDADSGQVIQGARVMLYEGAALVPDSRMNDLVDSEILPPGGPRSSRAPTRPSRAAETNGSGKSAFQGVNPGPYGLDADANGYISQRRQLSGVFDNGTFSLEALPPGNYRIYVWDGIDQSSLFDPSLLDQSRAQKPLSYASPSDPKSLPVCV